MPFLGSRVPKERPDGVELVSSMTGELRCYKTMPVWDAKTLPQGFRTKHNTQAGTWAKLEILAGTLRYESLDDSGEILAHEEFDPSSKVPMVEPQAWHRVEPTSEDLKLRLSFYCQPEDYYHKKYGLTATHSEVVELLEHIQGGDVLDLGCGRGRNSLFLQAHGFRVEGIDPNPDAIARFKEIMEAEQLEAIRATQGRAQDIDASACYDLIINTVVLMFLPAQDVPAVIHKMQAATRPGGLNLIVCAVDSEDLPLRTHNLPFRFSFKSQELRELYRGWELEKYNEDPGELHRLDAEGNRIRLRFATLLARKTS